LSDTFSAQLSLSPSGVVCEIRPNAKSVKAKNRQSERSKRQVLEWLEEDYPAKAKRREPIQCPVCPCWPAGDEIESVKPFCEIDCIFQTANQYHSLCPCYANFGRFLPAVDCSTCADDFECKLLVIKAVKLLCQCISDSSCVPQKLARDCSKCLEKVLLLLSEKFPACVCKDLNSTDLYSCRPYCKFRLCEIYNRYKDSFASCRLPPLRVWQKLNLKPILPVCTCWKIGERMVCRETCVRQISEKYKKVYSESCPCNPKATYKIDDQFAWLFRCSRCCVRQK
jgi:hypothetical protein